MTRAQPRDPPDLPAPQRDALARAKRIEWLTLALRTSVVALLFAVLGSSQSLNAIWLKSLWALLPPIAFLAACRIEGLEPTPRFPYGFYRAATIAFLSAALALAAMGLFLTVAGAGALISDREPGLESISAAPSLLAWNGWAVLAALGWSMLVPVISGRSRQSLAVKLHDKGLYADATMGRASWLAGAAAIVGVCCIGLGLSSVDALATLVIGLDVLRHGATHLYTAVCDLIDEVPREIGSNRIDPLGGQIHDHLIALDWVEDARVRLREEGRRLTGVAFVCPRRDRDNLLERFEAVRADIRALDWRLLDFELVPVAADRCAAALRAPRGADQRLVDADNEPLAHRRER